jgi:S1-C subfamily serine protease
MYRGFTPTRVRAMRRSNVSFWGLFLTSALLLFCSDALASGAELKKAAPTSASGKLSSNPPPFKWSWDKPFAPTKEVLELEQRADGGDERARAELSVRYRLGEGTPVDLKRSLIFCLNNSHPAAKFNLARLLHQGLEVEKDKDRAEKLMLNSIGEVENLSSNGDCLATWILGVCRENGWAGRPLDLPGAETLYRNSYDAGCSLSLGSLVNVLFKKEKVRTKETEALLGEALKIGSSIALEASVLVEGKRPSSVRWKTGETISRRISEINTLASLGSDRALLRISWLLTTPNYRDYTSALRALERLKDRTPPKDLHRLNYMYALLYFNGFGVEKDYNKAFQYARDGAYQGNSACYTLMAAAFQQGKGVSKNFSLSYAWLLLAKAKGHYEENDSPLRWYESNFSMQQILEAQKVAQSLDAEIRENTGDNGGEGEDRGYRRRPVSSSGTGFLISSEGYIATSFHVVDGAKKISIRSANGEMGAALVVVDRVNDVAILKAPVSGIPLQLGDSAQVPSGASVYTVGFPNPAVQGFEPKLTKGDINSLSGVKDDVRMFQISVPVQPGNSGGPLLNDRGEVLGIITSQLDSIKALRASGSLPQNVNFALKVSYLKLIAESSAAVRESVKKSSETSQKSPLQKEVEESIFLISSER